MKVGITHYNLNACGGAERVCITIMELLRKMGLETHLVTVCPPNWTNIWRSFGKKVRADKVYSLFPSELRILSIYQRILTIIPAMKLNVDLLINTHGDVLPSFTLKKNIPSICYCHFPTVALIRKRYPNKYRHGFWRAYFEPYKFLINSLMLKAIKRTVKVITNSKFSKEAIKELFGVEAEIIYPPVDVKTFNRAYHEGDRDDLVLVLGRISKEKQQHLAIKVISKLEDVKLALAGSISPLAFSYLSYLKTLAEKLNVRDRVSFHFNASLNELLLLMKRAKVLFHTMRGEHFGIAIVEGMCAGLIPVVWDYGGPAEFTPRKYQFHSIKEAPEKLQIALDAPTNDRRKVHRKAQEFSEKNFKKKFKNIIEEVLWM